MGSNFKHTPWRCKAYLRYVASHPCIGCPAPPEVVIAHHHGPDKGRALKCSDMFSAPLCEPIPGTGCHGYFHSQKLTLPGKTAEETGALFEHVQWRLMSRWLAGEREPRELFPGMRRF